MIYACTSLHVCFINAKYMQYIFSVEGKTCGSPPRVPNAKASPAGPFPVGYTHNYTCLVNYTPRHESFTTCQENGKWTNAVFECLRIERFTTF